MTKETIDEKIKYIEQLIKENDGALVKASKWGTKTLAYEIGKHRQGYYVLLHSKGLPAMKNELERQMKISDDILRYQTIILDEKQQKFSENLTARYEAEALQKESRQEKESLAKDEKASATVSEKVEQQPGKMKEPVNTGSESVSVENEESKNELESEQETLSEEEKMETPEKASDKSKEEN